MNVNERYKMIGALFLALDWLYTYQGHPCVVLTDSGDIACSVDGLDGKKIIGPIHSIEDMMGPDWALDLDMDDSYAVARRLSECVTTWVDKFGAEALADAKERLNYQ